jgi:2-(1,2-epoxy-1,2-dihydrophenyl)acetyl-CoA isomerase
MDFQELIFEVENGIAIVTLNRPKRLNALTENVTMNEFPKALEIIRKDDAIKVMLLTGAGDGFCSGVDVNIMPQPGMNASGERKSRHDLLLPVGTLGLEIWKVEKPVIAVVNGVAAGGGLGLCLVCDIRIASDKARFNLAFVKRGLVPDCGVSYLLPRLIGMSKSLELMWTGDIIDAQEALRLGMVNKVVPHEQLMKVAKEFAARIAEGPSVAIELTKKSVYNRLNSDFESQLYYETYAQNMCSGTEDFQEGVKSFLEKRKPKFKGV